MITPAIARQDSVERIARFTLLVNQRVAMEESVYLTPPTLWTLSVSVPLEGLECNVKQVGMQFIEPCIILQGLYRSWKTWKVIEFYNFIFQAWKVMILKCGSWKVMEKQNTFR